MWNVWVISRNAVCFSSSYVTELTCTEITGDITRYHCRIESIASRELGPDLTAHRGWRKETSGV